MAWIFEGKSYPCPIVLAMDRLTGKWKTNILWLVHSGTARFNAICRALPQVNRGVILRQLRALQRDGLVARHEVPGETVRHVEYRLTERCEALAPALLELSTWGRRYGRESE